MRYVLTLSMAVGLATGPALGAQTHDPAHHPSPSPVPAAPPEREAQVQRMRQGTARYRDIGVARRDGYRQFGKEGPLMGEHWYHSDAVRHRCRRAGKQGGKEAERHHRIKQEARRARFFSETGQVASPDAA